MVEREQVIWYCTWLMVTVGAPLTQLAEATLEAGLRAPLDALHAPYGNDISMVPYGPVIPPILIVNVVGPPDIVAVAPVEAVPPIIMSLDENPITFVSFTAYESVVRMF
jgi:hypothetical protein